MSSQIVMYLMYFKIAIVIQMASSLVLGASPSWLLGTFFCHRSGHRSEPCFQCLQLLLCTLNPDRKSDISTRISDSLLAKVDFMGCRLYSLGLISLNSCLLVWKKSLRREYIGTWGQYPQFVWLTYPFPPGVLEEKNLYFCIQHPKVMFVPSLKL